MEGQMNREKIREELKSVLKECVTAGTFWNRHFQVDDTIDIWRETNRVLMRHGEEATSFDIFYLALQQFKRTYGKDFDEAAGKFICTLETSREIALEEKPVRRRRTGGMRSTRGVGPSRSGTDSVKIKGGFGAISGGLSN
jgi:hypothetical protein